jgi:squalene-associated FAD-dependent desaturase
LSTPTLNGPTLNRVKPHVAIVGGGLAGMAAATALATRGFRVTLLEAKRRLGGRAGSYVDRETGEPIDHCQHVAMGCCTNYLDFCRQVGIEGLFERYQTLHFFGPNGRRSDFRPSRWLPAPLHLLPALNGLRYLSKPSRSAIKRAVLRLTRASQEDTQSSQTMLEWLRGERQPEDAIELFWAAVLVSALGDTLDRVSVPAARKVVVDGFMAARGASDVLVPSVSLGELYDVRAAGRLREQGVEIRLSTTVDQVIVRDGRVAGLSLAGGELLDADFVVLCVPWRRMGQFFDLPTRDRLPQLEKGAEIKASPITGVHLWFDRPIMELPHAVVVGRLTQWVFARTGERLASVDDSLTRDASEAYYQVVISGSHDLSGRERSAIQDEVLSDLQAIWPAARDARLMRSQIITEHESVFSMQPGVESLRPSQRTEVAGLVLAGDWTKTGWPATMEGAVRSGYMAAEVVLADAARPERILVADLPRGWLAKLVLPR